jgi:hypothetical protein
MELHCVKQYATSGFELVPGDTTIGRDISESKKSQMLEDFPDRFEVIEVEEPEHKEISYETKVPLVDSKESDLTPAKKTASKKK